jgi:hypothetical protein
MISIIRGYSQLGVNSSLELKTAHPLPAKAFDVKYLSVTLKVRKVGNKVQLGRSQTFFCSKTQLSLQ